MTKTLLRTATAALLLFPVAACDEQRAFGDADSIIVGARAELWEEIQDTVQAVLEPRVFTVRNERTFTLTHQDPRGEPWGRLRLFRQELLVGTPEDPWVAEALANRSGSEPLSPPEIVQVHDVWARQQLVTILVLSPDEEPVSQVIRLLDPLHELMDRQFREYAVNRMFVSGRDTALARRLEEEHSFRLLLPQVYRHEAMDTLQIFRNANPDPSELIRQVAVTWITPLPDELPSTDSLLAWRQRLSENAYPYPQVNDTSSMLTRDTTIEGRSLREIQAVWANPPDDAFPAGGPFLLRAIPCEEDDRLYLLDAWLYAPNREKYQYMLQLQTILDSFACS